MIFVAIVAAVVDEERQLALAGHIHDERFGRHLPFMMPLSKSLAPSAQTWNTTEPWAPASSSTPTSEVNDVHAPAKRYVTSDAACTPSPLVVGLAVDERGVPSSAVRSLLLRSRSAGPTLLAA